MKDLMLLMGFGAGMLAGMMLYKHNSKVKTIYNNSEKAVMDKMNEEQSKANKKIKNMKKKAEKVVDDTVEIIDEKANNLKKKLK